MTAFATRFAEIEPHLPQRGRARRVALRALRALPRPPRPGVRVVHYHYVFDDQRVGFASHLDELVRSFEPVSLSEAVARLRSGRVSGREVAVTFDDGFRNQLVNAAPLLAERGISACFFLVTGLVGAPAATVEAICAERLHLPRPVEPMTWADARELVAMGHEIGSHSASHRDPSALGPEELVAELRGSREQLERRLSTRIAHFSAPYGDARRFTPAVSAAARAAGYETCFSALRGRNLPSTDLYALRRDHLVASWPVADVRAFLRLA